MPAKKKTHAEYELELFEMEATCFPRESYLGSNKKILHECVEGHNWLATPNSILKGHSCPECYFISLKTSNDDYIKNLKNAKVDVVPLEPYLGYKSNILHKCSRGHEWKTSPDSLLRKGTGCPKCNHVGGYNLTRFSNDRDLAVSPGILYIIVLVNKKTDIRECVKIGITKGSSNKDVLKRSKGFLGYDIRIQKLIHGTLEDMFNLEQSLHNKWNDYRYLDSHKFPGYTELFKIEILPKILKLIPDEV